MKYGQQFAEELSGTSAEVQEASIDYKKLKKSIKRIENELQALGLSAEVLKQLLSAGSDAVGISEDPTEASTEDSSSVRRTASAISLQKRLAEKQRAIRKKRRQARARAEYELAGGDLHIYTHVPAAIH
jgi:predicted  nucleic acid-binding Zn-ribbon protein